MLRLQTLTTDFALVSKFFNQLNLGWKSKQQRSGCKAMQHVSSINVKLKIFFSPLQYHTTSCIKEGIVNCVLYVISANRISSCRHKQTHATHVSIIYTTNHNSVFVSLISLTASQLPLTGVNNLGATPNAVGMRASVSTSQLHISMRAVL